MDWNKIWTSLSVLVPVAIIVIGCFMSLTRQISGLSVRMEILDDRMRVVEGKVDVVDQRLSKLEGAFEERGRWESRNVRA